MAAVQQVTEEDEELVLISAGGQVIRTETNSINRYGSGARGVIVMRLAEGDTGRGDRGVPSRAGRTGCGSATMAPPDGAGWRQVTRGGAA